MYGIADYSLMQRLNGWTADKCSGIEIALFDLNRDGLSLKTHDFDSKLE
jgi:hypothetical protein